MNQLSSVALPGSGGTVSFKYDPFGRRIQKSAPSGTVNYLYDGRNLLEEVDKDGVFARYTQRRIDEPCPNSARVRPAITRKMESIRLLH